MPKVPDADEWLKRTALEEGFRWGKIKVPAREAAPVPSITPATGKVVMLDKSRVPVCEYVVAVTCWKGIKVPAFEMAPMVLVALFKLNVAPVATVVVPVKVFAPVKARVPLEIVSPPPDPLIVPEKARLAALTLLIVKVPAPNVMVPLPASVPIALLNPFRASVPPALTVTAEFTPKAPDVEVDATPACKVPVVMRVGPV